MTYGILESLLSDDEVKFENKIFFLTGVNIQKEICKQSSTMTLEFIPIKCVDWMDRETDEQTDRLEALKGELFIHCKFSSTRKYHAGYLRCSVNLI